MTILILDSLAVKLNHAKVVIVTAPTLPAISIEKPIILPFLEDNLGAKDFIFSANFIGFLRL